MKKTLKLSFVAMLVLFCLLNTSSVFAKKRMSGAIDPNMPIGLQVLPKEWMSLDPFNFDEKGWYKGSYVLTQDTEDSEARPSLYIINVMLYSYSRTKRSQSVNDFSKVYNLIDKMGDQGYDFVISPTNNVKEIETYTNNETRIEGHITLYAVNIDKRSDEERMVRAEKYANKIGSGTTLVVNSKRLGRKDFNDSVECLRYAFEERMSIEDITNYETSEGKVYFDITKPLDGDEIGGLVSFYQDNGANKAQLIKFLQEAEKKYSDTFKRIRKQR